MDAGDSPLPRSLSVGAEGVGGARRRYLLLAVLFAAFALWPLTAPGYFHKAHDARHSLFFLVQFDEAVSDGALIPRWGADHAFGYGYPTFVFISPLAYYLAEGFHLAGAAITTAVKLTYAVSILLGTLGMFLLAEALAGPVAGLLAAVLYTYAPYRFVDIYVRADLAETFALCLYPWALWAFWRLAARPSRRTVALAAGCFAALLLAHNVTALLFAPLLTGFILVALLARRRLGRWRAWAASLAAGILALAIAAFSLLPAVTERAYVNQEQWTRGTYNYQQHFVYPGQLLSPLWGYGYAVPGASDDMSFQVGLALLAFAALGLILGARERRMRPFALLLAIALVGYGFLMLPWSAPLWRALPMLALAQFPWRLLGVATLSAALLGSLTVARPVGRGVEDASALLLALVVVLAAGVGYAQAQHTPPSTRAETSVAVVDFERAFPDMVGMTAWTREMPRGSPKLEAYLAGATVPLAESDVPGARLEPLHKGGHVQSVLATLPAAGEVRFYTYYYPGWRAYVDGREVPVRPAGQLGVIALDVPAGEHVLAIRFGDTPLRGLANWATLAAVAVVTLLFLWPRRAIPPEARQC